MKFRAAIFASEFEHSRFFLTIAQAFFSSRAADFRWTESFLLKSVRPTLKQALASFFESHLIRSSLSLSALAMRGRVKSENTSALTAMLRWVRLLSRSIISPLHFFRLALNSTEGRSRRKKQNWTKGYVLRIGLCIGLCIGLTQNLITLPCLVVAPGAGHSARWSEEAFVMTQSNHAQNSGQYLTPVPLRLFVDVEKFPIAGRFIIARGAKTEAVVVVVTVEAEGFRGRGECVPYKRYDESIESVTALIESVRSQIEAGITRQQLQKILPPGAARNAIDCALWDLEAKRARKTVIELVGLQSLSPVDTAFTISLDTPEAMQLAARKASARPILKVKLGGVGGDIERIRAVREGAPHATLIADANEGWTKENIQAHLIACKQADFKVVEQPVLADQDELLRSIPHLVPLCADESVHARESLKRLRGLYEMVNIKLDKAGGLTEALAMAELAKEMGFTIMVGCMVGSSLAMAPAMMLSGVAQFVDLDGPLLLEKDRSPGLRYDGSRLFPPTPDIWG
jgi:L-Ala-D/L-Glu epimerase